MLGHRLSLLCPELNGRGMELGVGVAGITRAPRLASSGFSSTGVQSVTPAPPLLLAAHPAKRKCMKTIYNNLQGKELPDCYSLVDNNNDCIYRSYTAAIDLFHSVSLRITDIYRDSIVEYSRHCSFGAVVMTQSIVINTNIIRKAGLVTSPTISAALTTVLYPDLSIHLAILHPVHHVHFIRSRPSDHARELSAVRNIQTYSAPSRNPAPPRDSIRCKLAIRPV